MTLKIGKDFILPDDSVTRALALFAMRPDLGIVWAAGFFEGEGCISFDKQKNGIRRKLSIVNTDLEMLKRFQALIQCGKIYVRREATDRWKKQWIWGVARWPEIKVVLEAFEPYLSTRRLEKARQMLDNPPFRGNGVCRKGHILTGPSADVYITKNGRKLCAPCQREASRARTRRLAIERQEISPYP